MVTTRGTAFVVPAAALRKVPAVPSRPFAGSEKGYRGPSIGSETLSTRTQVSMGDEFR